MSSDVHRKQQKTPFFSEFEPVCTHYPNEVNGPNIKWKIKLMTEAKIHAPTTPLATQPLSPSTQN